MLLPRLNSRLALSIPALALFISNSVFAAAVVDPSTEPLYSIAPYQVSDTDLSSGTVNAYRPYFENGAWQGDLVEYDVSSGGILSTTVDLTTSPPTTTDPGNWSARIQFDAKAATWWNTGRKVIFHNGTDQVAFRWGNLSGAQQTAMKSADYVNYVRGDQSNEYDLDTGQGTMRKRYNLLGDIIHSNPVYVGPPSEDFLLPGYSTFKNQNSDANPGPGGWADRAGRVYIGANDGMLHVFDAATGDEVYAYIPSMVLDNLAKLAASPFEHTYFVDGELSAGDADFNTDPADEVTNWRTMLVGGLGSGGKGLFALDITHPDLADETYSSGNDLKILWEKDDSDTDIGYVHGKAQIARLADGKWYVISGNGYSSSSGLAKLLVIAPGDGTVTKVSTNADTGNGLSAPSLVDVDGDFDVDYAYAGDLRGNLWKFDFTAFPGGAITASVIYAAGVDKPITTAPEATRHPYGGLLIHFGTGSLLSATDGTNTTTQSIYAIWDGAPDANTTLRTQTLGVAEYSYVSGADTVTLNARTVTNETISWGSGGHKGWQVDLNIAGERLVSSPIVRAGRLQMVINNPIKGVDSKAGDAWLLELNYLNGGTGTAVFFDMNSDLSLDNDDLLDDTDPSSIPVGVFLGNGSFSEPQIARVSQSRDSMFINGLYLPVQETCTVDCEDGFQLGHVDVDTDSALGGSTAATEAYSYCYADGFGGTPVNSNGDPIPPGPAVVRTGSGDGGLGGATDAHQHEYDKLHGQVYMDYINLEPSCAQDAGLNKLNRITEVGIGESQEFFIIVGNADLSPGADITIGTKTWNIVEYQKMIMQKIADWKTRLASDPTDGTLLDDDGASLIFTLNGIISGGGTIRNSFNDRAIADGGLLPTQTGCVKGDPLDTYGGGGDPKSNKQRWRGGALYLHAIDKAAFMADPTNVVEQVPTDLKRSVTINGVEIELINDDNNDGYYLLYPPLTDPVTPPDTGYGGLRSRYIDLDGSNSDAFLYESTLFWHYKGSCYGTANWEADVNGAVNSSSSESLKSTLAALEQDLENAKTVLATMILEKEKDKKIAKQEKLIAELEAKIAEIRAGLSEDSVVNTGTPVQVGDETPELAPSLGPNFRTGRRTWIDLTP